MIKDCFNNVWLRFFMALVIKRWSWDQYSLITDIDEHILRKARFKICVCVCVLLCSPECEETSDEDEEVILNQWEQSEGGRWVCEWRQRGGIECSLVYKGQQVNVLSKVRTYRHAAANTIRNVNTPWKSNHFWTLNLPAMEHKLMHMLFYTHAPSASSLVS